MKMLELIQMGTWCPLCSERVSFTFEKWHQQGAWNYTPWTWGGRIWTPRDAHNVPRAEAQLMSCPGKGSGHGGGWGPQKRPEGEASPGHVADIRAREELGILRGVAGWHIPEREQNAAWRATGLAPGVQRSEGLWESRWQEAPLHQGPLQTGLHFKVTARGTFGELPWPLPNHSEYFCCKLLQKTNFCMAKEIETHRQASQNTQMTILRWRRHLNSHQRPGLTIPLRCKKSGRSRLKTQEQNRKSS